jgi:hypothetical protein
MNPRLLGIAWILLAASTAYADIPPGPHPRPPLHNDPVPPAIPPPPAPVKARLVIKFWDGDSSETRLRMPKNLLHDDAPPRRGAWLTPSRSSYVVGGAALALGLAMSGLWLARGGRRRIAGGAGVLLILIAIVGISGCPWTDDRGRIQERSILPLACGADGRLAGEARLESHEQGDIVLVIDRSALTNFATQSQSSKEATK